ncbi:hypothetical protein GV829_05540 [Sphingomonas lacunae]|uniref:Uncharacterized protein n=1 Tax=Sphingomonas lacunae TaxID=2698828 RepID=A0A6M4AUK2_9SPHN|nr:hypothetical protein [Sphingomonas lacunae]QJQ31982.1 hypothetical protein GV829_05540 [Sphingomonas lacunae]
MRSISLEHPVRLYLLDDAVEGGAAITLLYGTLAEALAEAARQPEEVQAGLIIQTQDDVVAYLDIVD